MTLVAAHGLRSYQPYTFVFRDGSFYAQTNRSIARGSTLRQEEFQPRSWYDGSLPWYQNLDEAWSNVSVGSDGEWYPKHSFLMPLVSTPFFVVLGVDGLLVFNALAMVLALFFGYRLAARFSRPESAAVGVFLVFGCPLVPYLTYAYSHDVFYAALVAGGWEALAARRPGLGGLLLGLSLVAKVTNVLVAAPVGLALLGRDRRALQRAVACGAAPLLAYAAANWVMYGSPLVTSYHRILIVQNGKPSVVEHQGFVVPISEGLRRFYTPSAEGEVGQMALPAVIAYLGSAFIWRRARGMAVALLLTLAGFIAAFGTFQYGGARFFMPWLVLSVVPGAALLEAIASLAWTARDALARRTVKTRRLVAGSAGALVTAVVVSFWVAGRPGPSASAARDVERLRVYLDSTPCDYFNMTHQKWECSHLDPGGKYLVGLAIGDQCPGMERPVLYVPAHPGGRTRIVRWTPGVEGAALDVTWTWAGASAGRDPEWRLRMGDGDDVAMTTEERGGVASRRLPGPIRPGTEVVLTLPGGQGDRVLCVSLEVVQ